MRHDPAGGAIVIMLRSLKMHGMAQAVNDLMEQGSPAFEAAVPMLSQLLKAEMAEREVRSIAYHMKTARFPAYKDLSGFDFAASEVNEALVRQLHRCEFMDGAQNVVLIGGPGTGKSHIATALGVQAIEHHRKKVRFFSTVELVVTARLLPRAFFLDAGDDVGLGDEVFEEVFPVLRGAPCVTEHVAQFLDAMIGEHSDRLVGACVDADDVAVAEVVVVADDRLQHFQILSEHPRDVVEGVDLCDGSHQAALACETPSGAQFHGSNSSSRLIL